MTELDLVAGRPTLGGLMALCEENFILLCRLAPYLRDQRGLIVSRRLGNVDLHLTIVEQSRYTSLVRLTHWFPGPALGWGPQPSSGRASEPVGFGADPDARLRIYHDARQVEVLYLHETALPLLTQYQPPALDAKWQANLFVGKWLRFCLDQGHRFGPGYEALVPTVGGVLLDTPT